MFCPQLLQLVFYGIFVGPYTAAKDILGKKDATSLFLEPEWQDLLKKAFTVTGCPLTMSYVRNAVVHNQFDVNMADMKIEMFNRTREGKIGFSFADNRRYYHWRLILFLFFCVCRL
jgi:hypothetical protein